MLKLTAELCAALEAFGIRDPRNSPRRQFPPNNNPTLFAVEHICFCTGRHRRVQSVPFEWEGQTILIGQCSDCGEIGWCLWAAPVRTWTGQTRLGPSTELYEPGQGKW